MTSNSFMYGARSITRTHQVLSHPEVQETLQGMMRRQLEEELRRDYADVEIQDWQYTVRVHQLPEPALWFGGMVDSLVTTTVVAFFTRGMDE